MGEEIEAKVKLDDPQRLRETLEACGLEPGSAVFEVNRLFDDAAGRLRERDVALRVREERDLETGQGRPARLTFKGRQADSDLKRRIEHETEVADAAALVAVLEAIGLEESFRYEKRRTTWKVGPCEVTLDEVPHLGWFSEIEGPDEASVRETLRALGLEDLPRFTKSYIALLSEFLEAEGLEPNRAVFRS